MRTWMRWRVLLRSICGIICVSFIVTFRSVRSWFFVSRSSHWPSAFSEPLLGAGLADLLLEFLADVADTFLLVRVGWTERAHFSGDLADLLAVDAADSHLGLLGIDDTVDARGQRILDR